LAVLLSLLYPAGPLAAQGPTQDVDRSFHFVERLSEATNLFNAGKPGEALAIYQELLADGVDLDEDGYAALGLGDCLVALSQNEQARAAYAAALAAHPESQSSVAGRIAELDVIVADDAALARLRASANSGNAIDLWRLGRALQKRAESLLLEAGKTFRAAAAADSTELLPKFMARSMAGHVAVLDELTRDLSVMVKQTELTWAVPQRANPLAPKIQEPATGPTFSTQRQKAEFLLETKDNQRVEVQLHGESDRDPVQVTVNGRPIELTETEKQLIQRHRDRINAILMEAAGRPNAKGPEGR
jgi:tetratricopeptide (TPR) repeat protein